MNKKGLTMSVIFEAESANYGEGVGNVTALKKVSRGDGESYTYISRQALRYNIIEQMGENRTPLDVDGSVIQFHPDAKIDEFPEIDLFGYMKTKKPTRTRSAVARLSHAISLESFQTDLDFLTNKGLFDRYMGVNSDTEKSGGNIAQSEIHKSYYTYTITVDLDRVGIDKNDEIEIENNEKAARVKQLLSALKFLYRDIKGRRENLSPLFVIGGVYDIKNPFFENRLKVKKNQLIVSSIKDVLALDKEITNQTYIGLTRGVFSNEQEIVSELSPGTVGEFFDKLSFDAESYFVQGE